MVFLSPNEEEKLILPYVLFFQRTLGMRVFICCINNKTVPLTNFFNSKKQHSGDNISLKKLQEKIKSSIPDDVIEHFSFLVETGKQLPLLIRQSKKGGYEFIIVDKSDSVDSLKPPEIDRLISHSYCPVMTVNKNYPIENIKKIVIPIDITQATKKKLLWATYFAKKYGAKIIIVSAITLNLDIKKSLVYKNSEKLKTMLEKRGVDCEVQIINAPGQEKHFVILDFIRKENPDMIIIRTHQESNRKNTQIGKLVSELIHGCLIPVFTVNNFVPVIPDKFEAQL